MSFFSSIFRSEAPPAQPASAVYTLPDLVIGAGITNWAVQKESDLNKRTFQARQQFNASVFLIRTTDVLLIASVVLAIFFHLGIAAVLATAALLIKMDLSLSQESLGNKGGAFQDSLRKECYGQGKFPEDQLPPIPRVVFAVGKAFPIWPNYLKDPTE